MSPEFLRLWGMPILLGILTAVGLVAALLGDGLWDAVSGVALGLPVLLGIWHSLRRQERVQDRRPGR
ncbi:hypothetical protein [Pseudoduganella albidiflava]|uniref:DUF4175 domain-containing protein n=1 Tax=Pseudoduganella albidiflava TaxID=321983 RepID=A0A411WY56_9BURK|nr:hypothetical protein [Pseudoduganella albidiflava]QBI01634.1 hypothetical protein EYF70_12860 [Pseudoduganella albidiflava]GGY34047.1 hypothetical protein GCM10007387_14950 [Pseudoduganella albidiflava]